MVETAYFISLRRPPWQPGAKRITIDEQKQLVAERAPTLHKIRLKILLITLLPSTLILGLLSFYLLHTRSLDLKHQFQAQGKAIAQQLATSALGGVLANDRDMLELTAQAVLRDNPDIRRIRITDAHGLLLAEVSQATGGATGFPEHFSASIVPTANFIATFQFSRDQPMMLADAGRGDGKVGEVHLWISPEALVARQHKLVANTFVLSLAGLLSIALLSVFLAQRIARPLEELTQAARALRSGRLDTRVPINEQGEVGELQKAFNEMAQEIAIASETLHARVEQATRELQESMEILEIKNVELDLARRKALQAYQAKSEFLASMSHEIRTPMNGVLGFINLLRKTPLNEVQQEYLSTIENSARNLLAIINDILDLSRLEAGKLNLERAPFSLRRCVDDTISLLAPMAHDKGLELVAMVYDDVPDDLVGDRTRIAQIITNLVNNAIKFTERGEVVLRLMLENEEAHRAELVIQVADTGVGIAEEDQARIFQTFVQGQGGTVGGVGGTGLGLSICKRLAEAMHGRIELQSTPGRGSTFTCHLVLDLAETQAAPEPPFRGKRVRLMESHPVSRQALAGILQSLGVVVESVDPAQALDASPATDGPRPAADLICLGAGELGDEVLLARLRRRLAQPGPPVVLLVGSASRERMEELLALGAAQCLTKPPRRGALINALRLVFSGATEATAPAPSPPPARPAGLWLGGKRILVADDNPVNRQLMQILLTNLGATVTCVENGAQAVERVRRESFDLLMLDIHMPELNGFQAARAIRALPGCDRLPMVAMTADAMSRNRRQLARTEFQAYLIKPIDERELMLVLHDFFMADRLKSRTEEPTMPAPPSAPPPGKGRLPIRDQARALRIAGGSATIADALFAQFIEHLEEDAAQIAELVNGHRWEEAWQAIHRLKGTVTVCAVPAFEAALMALQSVVQEQVEEACDQALARLAEEKERLLAFTEERAAEPPRA